MEGSVKQELPVVAMFVNGSELNEQSLWRTFHRYFLPSFDSFGYAVSEEKIKAILVSDWSISKKIFFSEPLGQMNRNLVGSTMEGSV
jgi:hypothetical protein